MKRGFTAAVWISVCALFVLGCGGGCEQGGNSGATGAGGEGAKPAASGARVSIQNKGSDTMIELAQAWSEAYHSVEPTFAVEVSGGGSGVGIAALQNATVDICNSSRLMTDPEIDATKKAQNGKEPVKHVVGYDALAVYVHKDNPLEEISIEQLKDIWAEGGKTTKWSELGVKVPGCSNDAIVLVSRQNNSGTYEYFKEAIIGKEGKYRLGTLDMAGSKDLVKTVGQTPCAIGYSGMGYKTNEVKYLKVKNKKTGLGVLPSIATTHDGTYPISRPLFMYTLGEATGSIAAYIHWICTDPGQKVCEEKGYVPLKPEERYKGK